MIFFLGALIFCKNSLRAEVKTVRKLRMPLQKQVERRTGPYHVKTFPMTHQRWAMKSFRWRENLGLGNKGGKVLKVCVVGNRNNLHLLPTKTNWKQFAFAANKKKAG